jgi:lysozyme
LLRFEVGVEVAVEVPLTDNQFAALVSFAFNVGLGALKSSTLLARLNARNYSEAAAQLDRWNKASGRVLAGLVRRRAAEKALFLKP